MKLLGNENYSPPSKASLGQYEALFVQFRDQSSPNSWVFFVHAQSDRSIPENELVLRAYYNPGLVVDNINPDKGHRTSVVFRGKYSGVLGQSIWHFQSDDDNDDSNEFCLRQLSDTPLDSGRMCFLPETSLLSNIGDSVTAQNNSYGNWQNTGYVSSLAKNQTTGRAAVALQRTSGEQTWLRHSSVTTSRDIEISSLRDAGSLFWKIFNDNSGKIQAYNGGVPQATEILTGLKVAGPIRNSALVTFADGDTSPSVRSGNLFRSRNGSPTTITSFRDGVEGQAITIIFMDGNTSISETGNIKISTDFKSTVDDTITLVFDGRSWFEKARSVN